VKDVDILITGGTILAMDERGTRIEAGAMAIQGDTIVAMGPTGELDKQFTGRTVLHAANSLIMPGLINGHTHAAMTCFRGMADDLELMTWLNDYIFPVEAKYLNPELAYWGSLLACTEMLKSGTTTFCDMYLFEEETAQAARQAGMRCLLGEGILDFPTNNAKTPAEALAIIRRQIEKWDADPLINVIIAPHSLYTVSPAALRDAKMLADEYQLPYGLHLLETGSERAQLFQRFGRQATEFLKDLGYLTERFLAFHCVAFDHEDIKLFADQGCQVVHTPESNMKLGAGIAPVCAMQEAGLTVGLGTDGCASNNNLDLFQEMDTAAKLQKVKAFDPTVMDAKTVLTMATREGAKALGLAKTTGSLEIGKKADIIILDLNKPHLTPLYNEYSQLVYSAGGADVDTVIINGKVVMRNRRLLTIDEAEVIAKVREIAVRIKSSLPA